MTAEIAILNKSAIALAADSAITIGDGADAKIYNTVNKIFELSDNQPLALMTYGNLEFMYLPIETVAKQYRRQVGNQTKFDTVQECTESFLDYLERKVPCSFEHERLNRIHIISKGFDEIARDINNAILEKIRKESRYLKSKSNGIAQKVAQRHIRSWQKESPSRCFQGQNDVSMLRGIEQDVDSLISGKFDGVLDKIADKTRADLKRLARCILYREPLSNTRTGFVVAGFGEQEICPSLEWVETDGIVRDKLKFIHMKSVDIGRDTGHVSILPFAQDEMIERFLCGVDPSYDIYVHTRVEQSLKAFASTIVQATISNVSQQKSILKSLAPVITQIADDFYSESLHHQVSTFRDAVFRMVQFMPKQELANLADSLIDLTSLKRKVSHEKETVGGEVDVAVVSKSEGLVWIKRKHYFPKELNPKFFERHYARQ